MSERTFPRPCGDEPKLGGAIASYFTFSPPLRG